MFHLSLSLHLLIHSFFLLLFYLDIFLLTLSRFLFNELKKFWRSRMKERERGKRSTLFIIIIMIITICCYSSAVIMLYFFPDDEKGFIFFFFCKFKRKIEMILLGLTSAPLLTFQKMILIWKKSINLTAVINTSIRQLGRKRILEQISVVSCLLAQLVRALLLNRFYILLKNLLDYGVNCVMDATKNAE